MASVGYCDEWKPQGLRHRAHLIPEAPEDNIVVLTGDPLR